MSENDCTLDGYESDKERLNTSDIDHTMNNLDETDVKVRDEESHEINPNSMIKSCDFDSKKFKIKNTKGKVVFD